jgi:hypothetical protein
MGKRRNRWTEAEARSEGSDLLNDYMVKLGFAKTTTIRPLADSPLYAAGLRLAHALRSRKSGDLTFYVTAGRETDDHWKLIPQLAYPGGYEDEEPQRLPGARPWGDWLAANRPDLKLAALLAPRLGPRVPVGKGTDTRN